MDLLELKKEQLRLAEKIVLADRVNIREIKTVGGAECVHVGDDLVAVVVVCEFPAMKLLEKQTYRLSNPLGFRNGYQAYREMPAIIEAFNKLEQEPEVLLVKGTGIIHPRRFGIASHIGLALNVPTVGVAAKLNLGSVENGKVIVDSEVRGFEFRTREHANPIYISPGHLVSLGSVLGIMSKLVIPPHKMPEPLHIAHKIGRKMSKKVKG